MELRARTTLPAGIDTPAAARAFVRDTVVDSALPVDDLTLLVSELVTTAVVSGSGTIDLAVVVDGGRILVEVADDAAAPATPLTPLVEADGAEKGLMLISRLAARWGIRTDGPRKVLWADLLLNAA